MKNSKGTVFYGMHFYPGVAEYQEPNRDPYRVFLNEDTIRGMGPSFAGRPVFVMHVDGVNGDVDELRKEADGWVVKSFFNEADGKHWVEFIAVTEKAEQAIKRGWKLSNCYVPKSFSKGGLWNGVAYAKEITGGEYEHLAIVPNPRYAESVILTPEKFKAYNEEKIQEVKRLSNAKEKSAMKVSLFKREKVANSDELLAMGVMLPNSKADMTIEEMVKECDGRRVENAADDAMTVEVDGEKITVGELKERFENAKKKANKDDPDEEGDPGHGKVDMASKDKMNKDDDMDDDGKKENDDEEEDAEADKKKKNKKKKNAADPGDEDDGEEDDEGEEARKANELAVARAKKVAKEKADRVRNAEHNVADEPAHVELSMNQVQRGKARYGSK
jgi:hypothetical protein